MEREVSDLVIVAHESVLRVLCAYFMENSADVWTPVPWDSPYTLGFPGYPEIPCLAKRLFSCIHVIPISFPRNSRMRIFAYGSKSRS